jgi:hypothetical protein
MSAVRIHDKNERGILTFDLNEVHAAFGRRGLSAYWTVGNVAAPDGGFDATVEGAAKLEPLAISGERIAGRRLAKIAKDVRQVIWGEFKVYEEMTSKTPLAVVIAFDSSWWEVQSDDAELLNVVANAFKHVERI